MGKWFTDFSEYQLNQQPHDWSYGWDSSSSTWQVVSSNGTGGKSLRLNQSVASSRPLIWDRVPETLDAEIVTKVRVDTKAFWEAATYLRARGTSGSNRYAYWADISLDNNNDVLHTGEMFEGSAFYFNNSGQSITYNTNEWVWIRHRAEGQNFYVKFWRDSEEEPEDWDIEYTSTRSQQSGWIGIGSSNVGGIKEFDVVGFATDGDTAPKEVSRETYYFDGSHILASDGWQDIPLAFDGDPDTSAWTTQRNQLVSYGNTAPDIEDVVGVRARIRGSTGGAEGRLNVIFLDSPAGGGGIGEISFISQTTTYSDWIDLEKPSGGWDLQNIVVNITPVLTFGAQVNIIELEISSTSGAFTADIVDSIEVADNFNRNLLAVRNFESDIGLVDTVHLRYLPEIDPDVAPRGGGLLGGASYGSLAPAQTFFKTIEIGNEYEVDIEDFITIAERHARATIKPNQEEVTTVDNFERTVGFVRGFDEEVDIEDDLVKNTTHRAYDTARVEDNTTKNVGKGLVNDVSLQEALHRSISRQLQDEVEIIDSFERFVEFYRNPQDTISISDLLYTDGDRIVPVKNVDAVVVTDEVIRHIVKNIEEVVVISDTADPRVLWIPQPERPAGFYVVGARSATGEFSQQPDRPRGSFSAPEETPPSEWTSEEDSGTGSWNGA